MSTKFGAPQIHLQAALTPVGFGLRSKQYLHQIMRASGFKDISAKVWGSRAVAISLEARYGVQVAERVDARSTDSFLVVSVSVRAKAY